MEYRFRDFDWLADMSGFNKPTDVYWGNVLLGVIISKPDGYVIERVIGPTKTFAVAPTSSNKYKTKNAAAPILHKLWKWSRRIPIS